MAYISGLADAYGNLLIKSSSSGLEFGGSTSAFPAIYSSGKTLKVRTADNSADGYLTAGVVTVDGYMLLANQSSVPANVSGFGTLYTKADGNLYYTSGTSSAQITTSTGAAAVTSVALTVPSFLSVSGSPITSSGTLGVTYSGTALPIANGGTALTGFVSYGVLIGNSSNAIAQVGVNSTANNEYFRQVNGTIPSWQQIPFTDITGTITLAQITTSGATASNVITYNGTNVVWGPSSTGTVSGVGVANQVALWNGTSSIDGYSNFAFNNSNGNLLVDGYLTLNYNSLNAVVIGSGTTISTGSQAVIMGYNNYDSGTGGQNVVIGSTSSAFGTGSGNIAIGNLAATGNSNGYYGIAIGYKAGYNGGSTSALGQNSIAIGTLTQVTGITGIAIGYATTNPSGSGVAIGNNATATGAAISIGATSTASGTNSIALGNSTVANATATTVLGNSATNNSFANSTALGYSASNTAANQVVLGTSAESVLSPSGILQFGGITSLYPSLRYSGNVLSVRLADNSADGYLKAGNFIADGYVTLQNQANIPNNTTNFGTLYTKTSDGNLYYVSGTGTTTQITPAGLVSTVYAQSTKTANYTLLTTDYTIFVTASSAVTITLPDATNALNIGRIYNIMRKDNTSNTVTLNTTSSQTINGSLTYTGFAQYTAITVQSDGSNWYII